MITQLPKAKGDILEMIAIKKLKDNDIPRLENWLHQDYILKWYKDPGAWLNEIRGRSAEYRFITHFIAQNGDKPFGFCQYYACADACEDWYGTFSLDGTYSIDYFIGEKEFLGKGYGRKLVNLLVENVFSLPDAKRIIVQPEEANAASCGTLRACGFAFDETNRVFVLEK